ncbi:MAG: HigA family addiction module antitoxin [Anaerolineae bacterium]
MHGKRAITADTAMRLAPYLGTSAEVWLRLQARYDLELAQEQLGERI